MYKQLTALTLLAIVVNAQVGGWIDCGKTVTHFSDCS